ncbi:MAG: Asp23/Gls24 family envelope stress response protein [Lachnospiraceae bacterium]|nr:Asp23/Gls24 family envelope stress response protein [Lachnospiraceae bacterium]
MKASIDMNKGNVVIENDVIAKCAGLKAVECFGIAGMATINVKDGLAKLLRRDSLNRGVNVRVEDNLVYIDLHVIISYGVNVNAVGANLKSNVKYEVERITGLRVAEVNVFIEGVRVID